MLPDDGENTQENDWFIHFLATDEQWTTRLH